MPKVDNFHITPEEEELFYKSCVFRSGYYGDKIDKKDIVYRKRNFENFVQQSQFPDVASAWNSLTDYQRDLWSIAGYWSNQSGWDLFAQDMNYRISNAIEGIGEANIYWQYKVGHIHIEAPASSATIRQVLNIPLPSLIEMSINYIAMLTSVASPSYAYLYLYYWYNDGSGYSLWEEDLWFDGGDQWYYSADEYDFTGEDVKDFYLEIDIHNMVGDLYFDGISLLNDSINLVNDWQCATIETSWASILMPAGASFSSLYSRNSFYNYYS